MTRSSYRPILAVGLVAATLSYVGCSRTSEKVVETTLVPVTRPVSTKETHVAKPEIAKAAETESTGPKEPKFITGWLAQPPAAVIVISGEQNGYPDPCGCTNGQLGGLTRRYNLFEKLQAKGWPSARIDLGNLIHLRGDSRGGADQERIKFDIIFEALGMMNYDAVALGPEDLKIGAMELIGRLINNQPPKFPVVLAANLKPQEGLGTTISRIKIAKAGPVTIGITSVIDPAQIQDLIGDAAGVLEVKSPDEVIPALLEELKKSSQIRVLMVEGPHEEAKRLAEKFPGFDIVVGTSDSTDPDEHPETVNDGKTLLLNKIGKKGKYVGVVGIFPDRKPMLEFRRQPLDQESFTQAEPMRKLIDVEYQERLKQARVVESFPRFTNGQGTKGAVYAGAESCKKCHPKTYEKWTTTKHAKAYEALENPKRNRIYDAECISCHTTGFGYKTGWVSAEKTPLLKGNQCENCHGPASKHAADPDNSDFRKSLHMDKQIAERTFFCTKCHDEDNDIHFSFDNRFAQIFHTGLDDYTDPKVHQKAAEAPAQGAK